MAQWHEIKDAVYARLEAEGRLQDFDAYRKELVKFGLDDRNGECAPMVATCAFQPLDGTQPEVLAARPDLFPIIMAKLGKGKYPKPPESAERKPEAINYIPPPTEKEKKRAAKSWNDLAKQVPLDRTAPELESIRWIKNNALAPVDEIDPDEVPTRGDIAVLKLLNENPQFRQAFYTQMWIKTLPDKKSIEYESQFKDDNRKQFQMLDAFLESFKEDDGEEEQ